MDVRETEPVAAGFFRRIGAAAYDVLALFAIFMFAAFVSLAFSQGQAVPAGNPWFRVFLLLLAFGYVAGSWIRGGQTMGGKAWKIKVEISDGAPIDGWTAAARFGACLLSWAVVGLGFAWILVDRDRKAWHDRICDTRVVRIDLAPTNVP